MDSVAAIAAAAEQDGRLAERSRVAELLHHPKLADPGLKVCAIYLAVKAPEMAADDVVAWVTTHLVLTLQSEPEPTDRYQAETEARSRRAALRVIEGTVH